MSLSNFRSYHQATALYHGCQALRVPGYVKDQLMRAALSIAANLGEGSGKSSTKDRCRYYQIALGSLREAQVILDLHGTPELIAQASTSEPTSTSSSKHSSILTSCPLTRWLAAVLPEMEASRNSGPPGPMASGLKAPGHWI